MSTSYTCRELAKFLGWGDMSNASAFRGLLQREMLLRLVQERLETYKSDARTAEEAIIKRIEYLKSFQTSPK